VNVSNEVFSAQWRPCVLKKNNSPCILVKTRTELRETLSTLTPLVFELTFFAGNELPRRKQRGRKAHATLVTPAQAGVQKEPQDWIPAFAGMTMSKQGAGNESLRVSFKKLKRR
jgi:hypothetical protein